MDGQRQYPGEPDRWFGDQPDDDLGRVPEQRGTERYSDGSGPPHYGEPYPEPPYGADRPGYGRDDTDYAEPPFADSGPGFTDPGFADPGFADPNFADSGFTASEQSRRRRSGRPVRVGRRSGLELPDSEPVEDYAVADEGPRYRAAERIDRQELRREGQTYQGGAPDLDPQRVDGSDQPGYNRPSYDPSSTLDQPVIDDRPGLGGRPEAYPTVPPAYPQVPVQPGPPARAPLAAPTQALQASNPSASVYLSRRPGIAILIGIATVVADLLLVPVLLNGEFANGINGGNVLGGLFGLIGVPMAGFGLYGLACGAATATDPHPVRAWLRPPLAYLPIGLILLIAAGLAA